MGKQKLTAQFEHLIDLMLTGLQPATLRAKKADLQAFADWMRACSLAEMASALFAGGQGGANTLVLQYRQALLELERAPATINRQLSSIRSLVKMGRMLGHVPWTLEVGNVKGGVSYRDTRGPGKAGVDLMLAILELRGDALALRNGAIVHLLFDLGLRRKEVCHLDMADLALSLERTTLDILGKGKRQKQRCTVPAPAVRALQRWLRMRGTSPGPLFCRLDRARGKSRARLTTAGLYKMISKLGDAAGLRARPHGLRHAAVTEALKVTGGDVRKAQRFARHANPHTTMIYDDDLSDVAGEVAAMVAAETEEEEE